MCNCEWRDIETAPRDGTVIVARAMSFDEDGSRLDDPVTIFGDPFKWCGVESGEYLDRDFVDWMPLPPPPAQKDTP